MSWYHKRPRPGSQISGYLWLLLEQRGCEAAWRKRGQTTDHSREQRGRDSERSRNHRGGGEPHPLNLRLLEPLGLGPPILEPDLHLGLGELQVAGELCTLWDGEILLLIVFLLQGVQLLSGERCSWFPVGFMLPQHTLERSQAWGRF